MGTSIDQWSAASGMRANRLLDAFADVHLYRSTTLRRRKRGLTWRAQRVLQSRGRVARGSSAAMKRNTSCTALLVPGATSMPVASPP